MRVAVCDDDRRFCHRMKEILEQYEEQREISMGVRLFYDGNELCAAMGMGECYDVIFLDVLMAGVNGVEAGKYIRRVVKNQEAKIIYVSVAEEYAVELFQNQPTNFLKKPVREGRVFQAMDEVWRFTQGEKRHFFYRQGRRIHQVPYSEILYYQSAGRKVQIHTPNRVWEYNGKLSHLIKEGLPPGFICIHKSYIVNCSYISEKRYDRLYVAAEKVWLSISQSHRKETRRQLQEFFQEPRNRKGRFTTNYDRQANEF